MRRLMAPRRERSDDELKADARQRGVQPARADVAPLVARLQTCDEDVADAIERLLARLGAEAARAAREALVEARAPQRGRLVRLVGRIAQETSDAELRAFLVAALDDAEDKARRNAVIALGKLPSPEVEQALIAAWAREGSLPIRRSIAASLGKIGGPDSLALLRTIATEDPELARIAGEAKLKLGRTLARPETARLDGGAPIPDAPAEVWLRCRQGLEQLVCDELGAGARPRIVGPGLVEARASGPLADLYRSRIALRFGFPLPVPVDKRVALEAAVVAALASPRALAIMKAFTAGTPRYRLEWASGGHRRGLTFRVAQAVAARRPELVNDPTASDWEAVVTEGERVTVELWPRGLDDPRFTYRVEQVPASSHPTLAAALARLGGARADDVVWDPFVGAATELIERARLGPYRRLVGTDRDARAIERAKKNLAAAGVAAELAVDDAEAHDPGEGLTLILTNPPMGRRVLDKTQTGGLLHDFIRRAARLLAPGGRLVWISPRAADTAAQAEAERLRLTYRQRVDMGGFWAELQAFERPRRR